MKQRKYAIDPELTRYAVEIPFSPLMLRLSRMPLKLMYALTPLPREAEHRVERTAEGTRLDVFEPRTCLEDAPCLVYFHGGGFGYMAAPYHKKNAALYALGAHCRVICPDYRLLPRHGYNDALGDCIDAIRHTRERFSSARILLGGDSAGAALAVGAASRAAVNIERIMLIYPVCRMSGSTPSLERYSDTPMWNSKNNETMRRLCFEHGFASALEPHTATLPASVGEVYIETAEFDCLHDEGAEYAACLSARGLKVTLNETRGTFHGYDIAAGAAVTRSAMACRIRFLSR